MDDFDWTLSNEAAQQAAADLQTRLSQARTLTERERNNLAAVIRALSDAVTIEITGR